MKANPASRGDPDPGDAAARVLWAAWSIVRLPIAAVLAICEPLVRVVLAGLALLFVLTAGFLALARPAHPVPVLGMLAAAVGLLLLLALYYGIVRALTA